MHHVYAYKFYDDYDNIIGKPIYSKYDENESGEEFETEIMPDEKLVGFQVRQSDWVDCKIAKVSWKIAKAANYDKALMKKVTEYKKKQKKEQMELEAKLRRDTAFCLERWDPCGGDIKWHDHASGVKESVIQSRSQVLDLMREKAEEKNVGFLHHVDGGVKAIIEKNITGHMSKNGCSIYLWAAKQNDRNVLNQDLAVIAGYGFRKAITQVEENV